MRSAPRATYDSGKKERLARGLLHHPPRICLRDALVRAAIRYTAVCYEALPALPRGTRQQRRYLPGVRTACRWIAGGSTRFPWPAAPRDLLRRRFFRGLVVVLVSRCRPNRIRNRGVAWVRDRSGAGLLTAVRSCRWGLGVGEYPCKTHEIIVVR